MKPLNETHIFIVEDNFMYSYVLEHMLKEYGNFRITSFASGEECVRNISLRPDVVILDYNLETGYTGGHAFNAIHHSFPEIPVIILSGQTSAQVENDLRKKGVFEYIQKKEKEVTFEKLLGSLLRALQKPAKR